MITTTTTPNKTRLTFAFCLQLTNFAFQLFIFPPPFSIIIHFFTSSTVLYLDGLLFDKLASFVHFIQNTHYYYVQKLDIICLA